MKKALNLLGTLALSGALLSIPVAAGTVSLTISGTGPNGTYNGDQVFPYYISVNNGSVLDMMCDDAQTTIGVPYTWNAYANSLTLANITNSALKFSTISSNTNTVLIDYEAAALIESDASSNSFSNLNFTGTSVTGVSIADANAAVWNIFDPNFSISQDNTLVSNLIANAKTAATAGGFNYGGITIYTPSPVGSSQEFLTGIVTGSMNQNNQSPVPEPGTYALLGGGLLFLGFVGRRARKA